MFRYSFRSFFLCIFRVDAKNQEERNSAMELYFQFGPVSPKQKALADLVHQMIYEPCFNTLRTIVRALLGETVATGIVEDLYL